MRFHVTFHADDLLCMEYTGNTSATLGHQLCPELYDTQAPSLYVKPGQLRAIAAHFAALAEQVGE